MSEVEQISFADAYEKTLAAIVSLPSELVPLEGLDGRALAQDVHALVNSPSADVSLKDGYAVRSEDIAEANPENPVQLELIGSVAAGGEYSGEVWVGTTVRILSGAPLPTGAQAILADEFAIAKNGSIMVTNTAEPGRNLLYSGTDIAQGAMILAAGTVLRATQIGLLAAAGHAEASVVKAPRVAIIATGDEVIAPGLPLMKGKLYASNLVTLSAWCAHYGMKTTTLVVRDEAEAIREKLMKSLAECDAILTSGGAWKGDRDLVVQLLDEIGWEKVFHRVKMGPGKAVGFGLYKDKPIFCLPGGPPSNHMAFLQLALPGLHKLTGYAQYGLPITFAEITESIKGRQEDWTQFVHVRVEEKGTRVYAVPLRMASRLSEMAVADGIVQIPEGTETIDQGSMVKVQRLSL